MTNTIRTLALAALTVCTLNSNQVKANEPTAASINCQDQPGASLCRDIRIAYSYLVSCSGGCDGLMYDQASALNKLANTYYAVYYPGMGVDQILSDQAYAAATRLCAYSWKDVTNVQALNQWIVAANRAIDGLKDLQIAGGRNPAKHCQFRVQN